MVDLNPLDNKDKDAVKKIMERRYPIVPPKPDEPFLAPAEGTKWVFDEDMSDEFEYHDPDVNLPIDGKKWEVNNKFWIGRKPSFFKKDNVYVHDGSLFLRSTFEAEKPKDLPPDFHTYGTSFVRTHKTRKYGYYEILCRMMDNNISSAFWFSNPKPKDIWTELDVFEYSTSDKEFKTKKNKHLHFKTLYNTNFHVHRHPTVKTPKSKSKSYDLGFDMSKRRVKIGFNWQKDKIDWYVNDVLVRSEKNDDFHQDLHLQLDSESFPDWFGMPDPKNHKLPAWFRVFYVRSWYQEPLTDKEKEELRKNQGSNSSASNKAKDKK